MRGHTVTRVIYRARTSFHLAPSRAPSLPLSLCPPHPLLKPAHPPVHGCCCWLSLAHCYCWGEEEGEAITLQYHHKHAGGEPERRLHSAMMHYLDMEALSWLCVAWGVLELGFLAVIMLHLVPRMNRLEAPAKVRGKAVG